MDERSSCTGNKSTRVIFVLAISRDGVRTSVKDRRVQQIFSVPSPVGVGEVTSVTAFIAKGFLESVNVVTVPAQEVASAVDRQRLIDVSSKEVIIS